MKKTITAISLAALALTGCGTQHNDAAPTETPTATASASATPTVSPSMTALPSSSSPSATASPMETLEAIETTAPAAPTETQAPAAEAPAIYLSPEVLAWQQQTGLPYYVVVSEDGTSTFYDNQGNPAPGPFELSDFASYPYTAEELARIEAGLNESLFGPEAQAEAERDLQEGLAELEATVPALPVAPETADPIGGDQEYYENQQLQEGTSDNAMTREQCEILDQSTAPSGAIQYCYMTYGL